jgi:hypothetical protein
MALKLDANTGLCFERFAKADHLRCGWPVLGFMNNEHVHGSFVRPH